MIVIEPIASPSSVANAVAVSPLEPEGASKVTVGVDVYPLPPFVTVIELTSSNKVLKYTC